MTKLKLPRPTAAAVAALGAYALALACPMSALAASGSGTGKVAASTSAGSESTPLNLGGSSPAVHSASGGASIVRTIVGLAIVIAVIVGLAWILRQVKAGRDPHLSSAGLTSIAALTLSSGRSVHLVRAGSEYVLLGSAEHAVVPIHRYTEQEARDAGLPTVEELAVVPSRRLLPRAPAVRAGAGADAPAARYDPTRIPSAAADVLERLREWTVRR